MAENILEHRRKDKAMTQANVADAAGISRPYYNMIENGVKRPAPDVAKRIAQVLELDWVIFYA